MPYLDVAFQKSIFRVRTSFGEVPGLLRKGEFLYRFEDSNLERFWELSVGQRIPPAPEYRARSRKTARTVTAKRECREDSWSMSCSNPNRPSTMTLYRRRLNKSGCDLMRTLTNSPSKVQANAHHDYRGGYASVVASLVLVTDT